jgi:hypothetical protein
MKALPISLRICIDPDENSRRDRISFLPVITQCPFSPVESPTEGDWVSVKNEKDAQASARTSFKIADDLICLPYGVLKFQRDLSLLGSNLASVGVL